MRCSCKKAQVAWAVALATLVAMVAVAGLTYTCYARDSCGDSPARVQSVSQQRASQFNEAPACPPAVNYSHPQYVCPPEVLARRRCLGGNQSAEYRRLGGPTQFLSQFWEDWFLYTEFFHEARYGGGGDYTFVELGGYYGRSGSNSYFYDKHLGWRGLLLEASTANYALLEKARLTRRVATIHGGVCTADRLLSLWGGHSLTANNRQEANGLFHGSEESLCVCLSMPHYMEMAERWMFNSSDAALPRIDYFSIDVEGQELEVIESHDWARWPVFVVSLEVAVQPLLSGTHEYQHAKRCALYRRGLCRWPFYDNYVPPAGDDGSEGAGHFSRNNEIWVNPALL